MDLGERAVYLSKDELLALLGQCPPESQFWINSIGGISVMDAEGKFVGQIALRYTPAGATFALLWNSEPAREGPDLFA
jgi:hypothetical protein